MRITVDVDDAVLERAIEAAAGIGITAEKLIEEALKAFTRTQDGKRLVQQGGTEPDMRDVPRRR